ncbi:RNA polymerase sigma factor, partial [mine drainage metagenome]
ALMHRLARQDEAALRELYDLHAAMLLGLLTSVLRDRAQAEDVLQQVFLQVWRTARHYDSSRGAPMAWLTQIARTRALDSLRRRRRESLLNVHEDEVAASAELERLPERLDVIGAMGQLSPGERRLVELCYLGGYSHREVAAATGIPLGTVKSTLRRAL